MAVVIETTLGDLTVDLFIEQRPRTCLNFLKLCKMKYYNLNLFHTIQNGFIAQTGDPTGEGCGGGSIWGVLEGADKRYFSGEKLPKIRHSDPGLLSMVAVDDTMIGSQFFFTLGTNLNSLDSQHCVIGEVVEGHEVLRKLNETICDERYRPYQDVRITHTVVLDDPFDDPRGFSPPSRSPSPSAERLAGGRLAPDEEIDETKGKTAEEIAEMIQEKEAKARATILEIVGDLPDADMAPPENVLFVCKLNPVTTDEDLEIIFSRFGKIINCEVIRDKKTGDSLQYAFIEFIDQKSCENAYFKMDNVLIDDRRIHVDFSQSVSKIKWQGKGRGVIHMDDDSRHPNRKRDVNENNRDRKETQSQTGMKQPEVKTSSRRQRRDTRSRSRDRRVDRSKPEKEKSRRDYDDQSRNNRSKDRYKDNDRDGHIHSYRNKDRNDHKNHIDHSRNFENKNEKERKSDKNRGSNTMKDSREAKENMRTNKSERRQSRSPHIEKKYVDNGHKSTHSSFRDDRKETKISNGERSSKDISRRRSRSASRCVTPPPALQENSKKRKLEEDSLKPDNSHGKKNKKEKETKKNVSTSRRKKKLSTSSESSSSDSSQSSTSSSSDSSSSESDRKKKKTSKKRKQIKKKKKPQSSSSSSDSSTDSSSSSSDSSSTSSSSESDSVPAKKKSKKKIVRKSKKVSSKKRKS